MSHVHDHNAMMANADPSMNHDHQMTNPSSGQGLHMKDMMMMAMTFHGGYKGQILFDQWNPTTVNAFVASWFAVFFLAAFYEGLKTLRDMLAKRDACPSCTTPTENRPQTLSDSDDPPAAEGNSENNLISLSRTENRHRTRARLLSTSHLIQTLLHIVQMALSYLLMLIAMTYNSYLFLAIVLGAGLGHFLFAWRRSSVIDYNEHCH